MCAVTLSTGCTPAYVVPKITATPGATPTPLPLSLSAASLTFDATTANPQTLTITDGVAGPYTASGCSGIVTASVSGTTVTVTSVAAGTCTLTITDSRNNTASAAVTVTTVTIPVT